MKIELTRLNSSGDKGEAFVVDMDNWPDCDSLLAYLGRKAGITILSRSSWMLADDFFSEFEFKDYRFETATPFTTPWLIALKGCPDEVFNELLEHVKNYNGSPRIRGLREIIETIMLPRYKGIYYIPKQDRK